MRAALLLGALVACGCHDTGKSPAAGSASAKPSVSAPRAELAARTAPAPAPAPAPPLAGDAARGKELALKFECNRCHDGTGHPAMSRDKHCLHCHEDITAGRFGMGSPKLGEWRRSVAPYRFLPSLENAGKRLRAEWVAAFLANPYDVRPNLAQSMPRLAVTAAEAADLAAYVTRDRTLPVSTPAPSGDAARGRRLLEEKGCGSCHRFGGVPPLPAQPEPKAGDEKQQKGVALAPDLRHARERFRREALVAWLLAPASLKPDTVMPSHGLLPAEAADIAEYVLHAELAPESTKAAPGRLPVLSRPVAYAEVERRVLSITCRHCHTDPESAGGDGGPGNTGGFGFEPRGLDLSTYAGAASGYLADDGERHSLFAKTTDGTPFLVAALEARRSEEAGVPVPGVRGMPLGLPALSAEDIQVVETWIAQGRPR